MATRRSFLIVTSIKCLSEALQCKESHSTDVIFRGDFRVSSSYGMDCTSAKPTIFNSVDLSEVELINVDFRSGIDFSSVTMPRHGVRIFNNPDGNFSKQLRKVAQTLTRDAQIPISILGSDYYDKQNRIIFETALLNNFLERDDSRLVFERVASSFEVTAYDSL